MSDEITRRWEEGVPHDPRSVELYKAIARLDWEEGGDFFCFKAGGDGDNGEHLMYLLDVHFSRQAPDDAPVCTGCGRPFPEPERRGEPVNFDDDRIT